MRYRSAQSKTRRREWFGTLALVSLAGLALTGVFLHSAWAAIPIVLFTANALFAIWQHRRQQQRWNDERHRWVAEAFEQDILLRQIGHELRTRLNGVLGYADLLLFDLPSPEAQEKLLTIQRHGGYLVHLVSDFMDVAKTKNALVYA